MNSSEDLKKEQRKAMERKTYSLRSRQKEQQTRLEFPCRRSERANGKRPLSGRQADENEASPPKRGRLSGERREEGEVTGKAEVFNSSL